MTKKRFPITKLIYDPSTKKKIESVCYNVLTEKICVTVNESMKRPGGFNRSYQIHFTAEELIKTAAKKVYENLKS